jgi:uncharacterized protein involved in exopolysaccharide biosynthesis
MDGQHPLASHGGMAMIPQPTFGRLEASNLREHYEDVAANTLRSIGRHIRLIAALVIIALASASLLVSQLPRSYSSEALIRPDLFRGEDGSKYTPLANIDGAALVSSEAQLIRSPSMVRTVIKRLGLEGDPEFVAANSDVLQGLGWVRTALLPETVVSLPLERAAARVRQRLTVTNDTRSYLISVSFTAASPEKAAKVANAFAFEYVRAKTVQRLEDVVAAASSELARRSAIYGEKHPSILQAKTELEAARTRFQAAVNEPEVTARKSTPGDAITLAEPSPTPSSPKGLIILALAFLSAVICGIGLAVWFDRSQLARHRKEDPVGRTYGIS